MNEDWTQWSLSTQGLIQNDHYPIPYKLMEGYPKGSFEEDNCET